MLKESIIILSTTILLLVIRKCRERKWGWCNNKIELPRKVVVITGANSGIGYQLAKEFARRRAQVIIACTTIEKANNTRYAIENELSRSYSSVSIVPMEIDLGCLKSVQLFCERVSNTFPTIDILINNAGVSYPRNEKHKTKDGLEIHFGINYLAHFYLTNLLIEKFNSSSRILIIASSLFEKGKIDLYKMNDCEQKQTKFYANSKLACVYFGQELARRIKHKHVNVYIVCPGWVYTSLFRHSIRWYHYILVAPIAFFFMRSPKQGCQTALHCATDPELSKETGLIYRDCKHYTAHMEFNDEIPIALWEKCEEIIDDIISK